jgi:hypothetical protein
VSELFEAVQARLAAFREAHRDCGELAGVMWLSGLYPRCPKCNVREAIRFEEIRRALDEEARMWDKRQAEYQRRMSSLLAGRETAMDTCKRKETN